MNKISGISGVILAGGESRRMGLNKALLCLAGGRLVDRVFSRLDTLFEEVLVVGREKSTLLALPCRQITDIFPGQGALVGIHAGLSRASFDWIFAAGCDMPFLHPDVIRRLCRFRDQNMAVVPRGPAGLEPLHALYSRQCLPELETYLAGGHRSILRFLASIMAREVSWEEFQDLDPGGASLQNINTPQDLRKLKETAAKEPLDGE